MPWLFNTTSQRDFPLSNALEERHKESGLAKQLYEATTVEQVDAFAQRLPDELRAIRPATPRLLEPQKLPPRLGGWRQVDGKNFKLQEHAYAIALEVDGDPHLLACWPDEADDLEPIDAAAQAAMKAMPTPATDEDYTRLQEAGDIWELRPSGSDAYEWAIYTTIGLLAHEQRDVAQGITEIESEFDHRIAVAHRVVDRIAEQIDRYFDSALPARYAKAIPEYREELAHRAGVTASLRFPAAWKPAPPRLAAMPDDSGNSSVTATSTIDAPAPLTIDARQHLDPATFADVQRVIRIWANAVTRTPKSFAHLGEDAISDLLAATLNATMPGAGREVYSQNGRSDIFIHADVLAAGAGPATVFICESKIARSEKVVREALDPQLFSYLNAHDTAAVLLLLMPQKVLRTAEDKYLRVLRTVNGYRDQNEGPAGWPVFTFDRDGRTVQICVATVHIPST